MPNGRVDFELYYRLLAGKSRAGTTKAATPAQATPVATSEPVMPPAPVEAPRIMLATARGPNATYRVGENLVVQFQPTQDAFVYCYYRDPTGMVARIFPNRFQPDAFTQAGRRIEVPPAGPKGFEIRMDRAGGRESVACLASNREVGLLLPDALKAQDLQPLPVNSLDEVAAQFRAIPGAQVDAAE